MVSVPAVSPSSPTQHSVCLQACLLQDILELKVIQLGHSRGWRENENCKEQGLCSPDFLLFFFYLF